MTDIKIDDDIPLPPKANCTGPVRQALLALQVGQSFELTHFASGSITLLKKSHPKLKFTRRKDKATGLVRIWRME
jgi:hypothetical protein